MCCRYKQLLLKQRDIMIALTARLNERDEQIMTLQVSFSSSSSSSNGGGDILVGSSAQNLMTGFHEIHPAILPSDWHCQTWG
jgi:hypothetical protein